MTISDTHPLAGHVTPYVGGMPIYPYNWVRLSEGKTEVGHPVETSFCAITVKSNSDLQVLVNDSIDSRIAVMKYLAQQSDEIERYRDAVRAADAQITGLEAEAREREEALAVSQRLVLEANALIAKLRSGEGEEGAIFLEGL